MDAEPAHHFDRPERSEAEQRAFFSELLHRARTAQARAGARVHRYDIDGISIRVVFAGPALERHLTEALAHLEVEDLPGRDADATFHVWDSASTGVQMFPAPCDKDCFTQRGDIWGLQSPHTRSAFDWTDSSVMVARQEQAAGVYWVAEVACLGAESRAAPLRILFHWALRWHGRHLLRGAILGGVTGGILVTGTDELLAAVLSAGAAEGICGDGACFAAVSAAPEPRGVALYATRGVAPVPATALRALALAEPAGGARSRISAVRPVTLRAAACFATSRLLPHAGWETQRFIETFADALPGFSLQHDGNAAGFARLVRDWLAAPSLPAPAIAPARPSLSVVIPVHDGTRFLGEAVASIAAQGWEDVELVVVDDGSRDAAALAEGVAGLPMPARLLRQDNAGPAAARNLGICHARGALLAFLDVDDLWPYGRLDAMADALAAGDAPQVVRGHAQVFRHADADEPPEYLGNPAEAFAHYIGAALYHRAAFEKVGLFDPDLRFGEDTDWFTRAEESGLRMVRLPMTTLLVRRHDRNMTLGRNLVELNRLRVFKKMLDRKRLDGDQT